MHEGMLSARTGAALGLALAVTVTGAACSSIGSNDDSPGADGGTGDDGGPPSSSTCSTQGGSRLRQVVREAADGSQEHLYFQDTELDTPCRFAPAADGSVRCLPRPGGGFRVAEAIYTDGDCETLLAEIGTDQPAGDRMELHPAGACTDRSSAYHQIGANAGVTEGQQTWVLLPDGSCLFHREADLTAFNYRAIGPEIPLEALLEASETMVGDGRLQVPRFDGADGSSQCRADRPLRDQEQGGAACDATIAEDGMRRCLPLGDGPITDGIFTDMDCGAPIDVGLVDRTCQPDATAIREYRDGACGSVQRVRALGAPLEQVYWNQPGECAATPESMDFFRIGPAVAPDSFAALNISETAAGDRLLQLDLTGEGVRFPSGLWRDPMTGADCRFDVATDGVTRCLPTPTREAPQALLSTVSTITYTDEDCTMPILVTTLSQSDACGGAAPSYAVKSLGAIEDIPDGVVYQLGDLLTDPIYRKAGTCALYQPGEDLYAVGPVVPPESFVSAIEVTE